MKSGFSQILEKINISDRMNTRILKIIKDAKDYCSSSAGLELPMQMTGILRMYLKMLHVKWRHFVVRKRRILRLKM